MRIVWTTRRLAVALLLVAGAWTTVPAAAADARGGNVPEGIWVLNQQRSKKLVPGAQTLWIVKDDGKQMAWVGIETDAQQKVKIHSWNGTYDGKPVAVVGTGMSTQLTSPAPGKIYNFGTIPGKGKYAEHCELLEAGKRLYCEGEVTTPKGVQKWIDDFDFVGPSPHVPLP